MLDNTCAELTLKNDKFSQRRTSDDCNPMESDHVWKRSECWKSWKSTQFLTNESRRRLTGEPSCKFLCMSYHLHVWGGCLGCGRTTERSAHHTAPSTLPTQTMMTIHSGLQVWQNRFLRLHSSLCVYASAVDLTTATHWSSQGWADTSAAFLSRTHKPHSPLWSAGPASSAHPPPHTHTPLVTHTAVCGSSPAPLDTSILKVLIR